LLGYLFFSDHVFRFQRFFYYLGTNKLTVHIFADHPGQSGEKEEPQTGKGRAKKGPGKTVSTFYRLFIFRRCTYVKHILFLFEF
jgi:hypothetical protein